MFIFLWISTSFSFYFLFFKFCFLIAHLLVPPKAGYGFPMNGRLAWILQECPCPIIGILCLLDPNNILGSSLANKLLFTYFMCHYIYRAFIFPFLMKAPKPTPFVLMLMALIFCLANGYLQTRSISKYNSYSDSWVTDWRFISGMSYLKPHRIFF